MSTNGRNYTETLSNLEQTLARFDERQKAMGAKINDLAESSQRTEEAITNRLNNHSGRIREIEKKQYTIGGAFAFIAAAAGAFGHTIVDKITGNG